MGNYNDALLEELADKGQGFYAYVDSPEEARRIFVDELSTTMETIALDAKAQIEFNPELVAGYRLIGYEDRAMPDSSFRNQCQGRGISTGQVTALYALVLRPRRNANQRLATVTCAGQIPRRRGPGDRLSCPPLRRRLGLPDDGPPLQAGVAGRGDARCCVAA
jgi:Ca-activated chloride channel family protein